LKLDLEEDATAKLIERAVAQKRPVGWQAEVLLREALGLPSLPPRTEKASGKKKTFGEAE
jgi:hypothetical protein